MPMDLFFKKLELRRCRGLLLNECFTFVGTCVEHVNNSRTKHKIRKEHIVRAACQRGLALLILDDFIHDRSDGIAQCNTQQVETYNQ